MKRLKTYDGDVRVGMIFADTKRNPDAMFLVTHLYKRVYKNGEEAERVVGISTGKDDVEDEWLDPRPHGTPTPTLGEDQLDDLDVRSLRQMYSHVVFDPHVPDPDDDK